MDVAPYPRHRVRIALAVLLSLGLVVAGGWVVYDNFLPPRHGSVSMGEEGNDGSTTTGISADVGDQWAFGLNTPSNKGKSPIRLVKAELLPEATDSTVQIVAIRVDDIMPPIGATEWPDEFAAPETTKELNGFMLAPGATVSIVFVVEPTANGRTSWTKTRLTYVENGKTRVTVVNNGLAVCAPFDLGKPCIRPN